VLGSGVQHCALVPNFPYRQTLEGPLQSSIVVDGRPTSYAVVGNDRRLVLVKDVTSSSIEVIIIIIVRLFLTRRNTTKTLQGRAVTVASSLIGYDV